MGSSRKISFLEDLLCQVNFSGHQASSMETPTFKNISVGEIEIFSESVIAEDSNCNLKYMNSDSQEDLVDFDHRKRPLPVDDLHQLPFKREKHSDPSNEAISFELPQMDPVPPVSEAAFHKKTSHGDALHEDTSGSTSSLSWVSCNTAEDDYRSDLPFQTVSSPHLSDKRELPIGFTSILDYYPRRNVVLGPNHQVDIPVWRPRHAKMLKDDINEKRLMGSCIIPMPSDSCTTSSSSMVAADCGCDDSGSINCVKLHVMEARERIKRSIGSAQFIDLGFTDMGESVALRWMKEEEQIFREVVAENPASLGKNFWSHLPKFLPSKTSKDLVSYYFNVFILRKRAEQNRWDPLNVDSDNDEWQEDCECDSAVKMADECAVYDDDSHDEDDREAVKHFLGNGHIQRGHHEIIIRDESCISYEGENNKMLTQSRCGSISGMVDQGYLVSPEAKPWDLGYFSGQENNNEFLPTCHVIEEVFGEGSWAANESNDGHDVI